MNVYIDKECASSDFSTRAKLFLNSQVRIFTIRVFRNNLLYSLNLIDWDNVEN